jgi:hypothetical protein
MKKFWLILILSGLHFSLANSPVEERTKDMRIKMLNGEYGKLSDYIGDGPTIVNFWTTW